MSHPALTYWGDPRKIRDMMSILKPRISGLSALSAMTGYLLSGAGMSARLISLFAGFFLVTAGASGLNNIQDRRLDRLMNRTMRRPLPTGRIQTIHALVLSLACFSAGFLVLAVLNVFSVLALSLIAVFWYNGVYAVLKRYSMYASFIGALAGVLPPVAGWIAGGAAPDDRAFVALVLLFVLWQVPHFMLHQLSFGREYEQAGLPSVGSALGGAQLSRISFAWLAASTAAFVFAPLFGLIRSYPVWLLIILVLMRMLWRVGGALVSGSRPAYVAAFRQVSISVLAAMFLLSLGGAVQG